MIKVVCLYQSLINLSTSLKHNFDENLNLSQILFFHYSINWKEKNNKSNFLIPNYNIMEVYNL